MSEIFPSKIDTLPGTSSLKRSLLLAKRRNEILVSERKRWDLKKSIMKFTGKKALYFISHHKDYDTAFMSYVSD